MRRDALFFLTFAVVALATWLITRPRTTIIEDTAPVPVVTPPAPIVELPSGHNEIVVADSSGCTETRHVERGEDVGAAVTVESDTVRRVLLIDRRKPRWFPDVGLVRDPVSVRTLGDAGGVTVTHQRMPVLALQARPIGGLSVDPGGQVAGLAGVHLVRAWILHGGAAVAVRPDGVQLGVVASVQVRDHLFIGAMWAAGERRPGLVVAYGF